MYIDEKILNLIVYLLLVMVEKLGGCERISELECLSHIICLNSDLDTALNDIVKRKMFTIHKSMLYIRNYISLFT